MAKRKKGQLTIFIILSIVLLFVIISIAIMFSHTKEDIKIEKFVGDFHSYSRAVVQECLENSSLLSISFYGLNKDLIKSYLESSIPICVGDSLSAYKDSEDLSYNFNSIEVAIENNVISFNLEYPFYFSSEDGSLNFKDFDVKYNLVSYEDLALDSSCALQNDVRVFSFDRKFNISIDRGTIIRDRSGSCVDKIFIEAVDTLEYSGDRSNSIGALTYLLGPKGTELTDSADLELRYSQEDYDNYIIASVKSGKFFELEKNLKIKYFDRSTNDYYIYLDAYDYWTPNSGDGIIKGTAGVFYGDSLPMNSDCSLRQDIIVESENNRVDLILESGKVAKKDDGSCLDKIDIKIEPRRSNVVTFGDNEYLLEPEGSGFNGYITYVYNYNLADISDPRFLYGQYNTQDLITKNWSIPVIEYDDNGIRIDEIKERVPGDLKIAYYDKNSRIYVPWETRVNTNTKQIIAYINHFSSNIPAQGCNDWTYLVADNLLTVPLDSSGNCSGQSAGPLNVAVTVVPDHTCTGKKQAYISAKTSPGDYSERSESDNNVFIFTLEDKDKEKYENVCADMGIVMALHGVGLSIDGIDDNTAWMKTTKEGDDFFKMSINSDATAEFFGADGCDHSADRCNENLCNRCAADVKKKYSLTAEKDGPAFWERVNICVRGESCGSEKGSSGGEEYYAEIEPVQSGVIGSVAAGKMLVSGEYSIKKIAELPNYLWFMANVGDRLYSGSYSEPQMYFYSDYPFESWKSVQISTKDESTRVYNLNDKFYAMSEGGMVWTEEGKCFDLESVNPSIKGENKNHYTLAAEYYNENYLISINPKGKDETQIFSCPCSNGNTCSLWKKIGGMFTFHTTVFNNDLYLIGASPKNYRTSSGGKIMVIRANGKIETLISSGPGSGVGGVVFDNKIFAGFSYNAEVWSSSGLSFVKEKNFPGFDHFGSFAIFDDRLFAAVVNEGGGVEIWYRNTNANGGDWVRVFDATKLGGYGMKGNMVNGAGFFVVYKDKLYFNINSPKVSRGGPGYILEISKADPSSGDGASNYDGGSCSVFPSPKWATASPSSMGLDESKLASLKNSVGGRGAVYYKGVKVYSWGDTTKKGDIASASKPILSLILFYSIANGKISGVDKKISDYVGSCASGITFHHVANMISGYALGESAGSKWAYNDRGIALYATTLFGKAWGSSAQNVFNKVFAQLNFQNSPSMNTGAKSGRTTISVDDFARIGLLVSCKGNWNGNQIIPGEYFDLIKNQVSNSLPTSSKKSDCSSDPCKIGSFGGGCNQDSAGGGKGRYGYNFWVFNEEYNQGIAIPSDTIILSGHFGSEHMIIIPSLDIVAAGFGNWGDTADDSSKGFRKNVKYLADSVVK